jgi:hypothetical protein
MSNKIAVTTAAVMLWVGSASAQAPKADKPADKAPAAGEAPAAPPPIPKPAPENDVIKKSAGTWTCEGVAKGPDGKEMKYKATWAVKPVLAGHWFAITYKRAKMGPMPAFEGNATVGYNVAEKKYSFIGFDNFGSWINLASTDGAVYTGEGAPMGHKGPAKFTFSAGKDKKGQESDKLFDVTLDFGAATSSENCKK